MTTLALMINYIGIIAQVASVAEKGLAVAPGLIAGWEEYHSLIGKMVREARDPTDEEYAALNAAIARDSAILDAPLA